MYNEGFNNNWDPRLAEKLKFDGFEEDVTNDFADTSFENISRIAAKYVDGLSVSSSEIDPKLKAIFDEAQCEKLDYVAEEHQVKEVLAFLDKVIEAEVLI
jgi:hypothetical protein